MAAIFPKGTREERIFFLGIDLFVQKLNGYLGFWLVRIMEGVFGALFRYSGGGGSE